MGETKTVLMLIVVIAFIGLLSLNYSAWINKYNVEYDTRYKTGQCEEVYSYSWLTGERYVTGASCKGDIPAWFNLVWVIPLGISLIYAVVPFVK